jgi:nitroreductase
VIADVSPLELLTTTRSLRRRLDLSRPVSREVIVECLRIATHAPNASNRQAWRFLAIDDPVLRAELAQHYKRAFEARRAGRTEASGSQGAAVEDSARYLAEHLASVPAIVIPCIPAPPSADAAAQASAWASILPAAWSFMLAARLHGLGSVLTTVHLRHADDVAGLLGIPPGVMQAGLIPVAYALACAPRPAPRAPVETVIGWNGWRPDE